MEQQAVSHRAVNAKRLNVKHRRKRSTGASVVTNNPSALLPLSKLSWCRRMRDLIEAHVADLGGWDVITSAETALLRRSVVLIVELERRETLFAEVGRIDDDALCVYQSGANTLRRLLETLGLHRRAKDVTTFGALLRADQEAQRRKAAEDAAEDAAAVIDAPVAEDTAT